jgi:hypothetical protein
MLRAIFLRLGDVLDLPLRWTANGTPLAHEPTG